MIILKPNEARNLFLNNNRRSAEFQDTMSCYHQLIILQLQFSTKVKVSFEEELHVVDIMIK